MMFALKKECIQTVDEYARFKAIHVRELDVPRGIEMAHVDPDKHPSWFRGDYLGKATSLNMTKFRAFMDIYDHLISDMGKFKSAPKVMGIELTETKLAAIRGYIVSVVLVFLGTVFSDYVEDYNIDQ